MRELEIKKRKLELEVDMLELRIEEKKRDIEVICEKINREKGLCKCGGKLLETSIGLLVQALTCQKCNRIYYN